MSEADEMLAVAAAQAAELATPGASPRPRRRVAVLACMDARIDLFAMLGLRRGDAHIVRNAGGLVTDDAIRSLAASQRLLGTEEVVVVMHRGCGLQGASDKRFAESLEADGAHPSWRLGGFEDLEEALRQGLARLRSSPELISRDRVRGFVFDPETGSLHEPEAPPDTDQPSRLRDTAGVIAPPPLIYLAGLAFGFALDALLSSGGVPGLVRWLLGPLLLLAGLALMRSFVLSFGRAGTPIQPGRPTTALVTGGPYAHTRNPGYLGMALLAAGIALLAAAPWALAGVAAAMLVVDRGVIRREERYLEGKFGAEYAAYRSRVRRWL